jgi:hypothetical protein
MSCRTAVSGWMVLWLLAASPALAQEPAESPQEARLTIVTASSHCDWAWGHPRAWHAERYAETIRQVLLLMREHPRYVWQLENENEQLAPFLEKARQQWPELADEFWQRVREGRIEVIVAITNPRISEVYPELFVRNLVLGKEYFRRHAPGIRQEVYNAVDLMVGHGQVAQLLAQADYRYFMFSRPCGKKLVFWRVGLDGTRMLSVLQHYGYEGITVGGVKLESNSGDDILPSAELAQAAETWDPAKKVLATSARYFEELDKSGAQIPEMKGVLDSLACYIEAGLHGNHNLYTQNNQNEDLLLSLEKAQVMASATRRHFAQQTTDRLWHDVLSCAGHAICWSWKPDYDERMQKSRQTRTDIQRALGDALAAVARAIRFRSGLGSPLVVFNFHAWPVTGPVQFHPEGDTAGVMLRDGDGQPVALQAVADGEAGALSLAFIARDVPPCGFKTFYLSRGEGAGPSQAQPSADPGPVENELYRVTMQPNGRLDVFDKARGESLGSSSQGGLGVVVFYDMPVPTGWEMKGPRGTRHDWQPSGESPQFERGPVYSSILVKGTIGPHKVTRGLRLWQAGRRIDYLVEADAAPGSGILCIRFPVGMAGKVWAGIPFGAEPRDDLGREPLRGEYFVQGYPEGFYATRWADLSSPQAGYTLICPWGMHTGYASLPAEQALEFVLLRVRPMPKGTWGQAHPSIQGEGHHTWRCTLVPHAGTWREAATYRDALESHVPLLAFSPEPGPGRARVAQQGPAPGAQLPDAASFAEVSPANVVLSTLRPLDPEPQGKTPRWELRLYETAGRATDVVVRLSSPVGVARETNLLGEPAHELGKIEVDGSRLRFRLPAWKIVTLQVTPAAPPAP